MGFLIDCVVKKSFLKKILSKRLKRNKKKRK
jgi:hypothetical protein